MTGRWPLCLVAVYYVKSLDPYKPRGLSHPYQLDESIFNFRVV